MVTRSSQPVLPALAFPAFLPGSFPSLRRRAIQKKRVHLSEGVRFCRSIFLLNAAKSPDNLTALAHFHLGHYWMGRLLYLRPDTTKR
jgi:hypothetical protein